MNIQQTGQEDQSPGRTMKSEDPSRTRFSTLFSSIVPVIGVAASLGLAIPAFGASGSGGGGGGGGGGGVNIPTGMPASPLFNAQPFTQQMLRFEEFGPQPMPQNNGNATLPLPTGCQGQPNSNALDNFLGKPLQQAPTEQANITDPNPWAAMIQSCVPGLAAAYTGVMEGRAPGPNFGHQRWNEFFPQLYFQSAQTGARTNGGFRDNLQKHGYSVGEFGPSVVGQEGHTGLYHNTVGPIGGVIDHNFDGSTRGIEVRIHTDAQASNTWPLQDPLALWTFDGTFPPKLLMVRYGLPVLFRHYNALPIDIAANRGFGEHTITTHEHNGHTPAESDGFFNSYFYPGEYFDYRWPIQLAGYDTINTDASNPRAATPCSQGEVLMIPDRNGILVPKTCGLDGTVRIRGDWRETMSTHWFHDHMIDRTAQNVYKGNAAMMNYYSAVDRGREGFKCNYADPNNVNLCLPSGTALEWGNRDYDVDLMVADKAFDSSGQLDFNIFNLDGFLGDVMTVNWLYDPYLNVRARRYRFRILNGSVSRFFKIAVVREFNDATSGTMPGPAGSNKSYSRVPFHMIANDGNLMEHAVPFPNAESKDLPVQGIAERYDIVIDFSAYPPGTKLYLVNTLQFSNGTGPDGVVPLAAILNGTYQPVADNKGRWSDDPTVSKFLELRVQPYDGTDLSMNPADYEVGKKQMIPLVRFTDAELAAAKHRTFEFGKGGGDPLPWSIATDGGSGHNADPHRVSAAPEFNKLEIWHLVNGGGGWGHPVHIHFEEGQILTRGNKNPVTGVVDRHLPPQWEVWSRKDVYRISPLGQPNPITGAPGLPDSSMVVDLVIRFREFAGTYMEHCHNTQHEDNAMLVRWDSAHPGQTLRMPTPEPNWNGVSYGLVFGETTVKTGDAAAAATFIPPVQLSADQDNDGIVNLSDFNLFAGQFGLFGLYTGDLDGDSVVNLSDFNLFAGQFGQSTGYSAPTPPLP